MILLHRTVETGHVRESPRAEVDDAAIRRLRPLVRRAIETSEAVALEPSPWSITAAEHGDRLDAQCWRGDAEGEPHVRLAVDRRRRTLDCRMVGISALRPTEAAEAAIEAGDLERCIAWAWIEGAPACAAHCSRSGRTARR
ncbi:MAG: hypothetical protein OXG39_09955 [Chloroflexi bacterium]|nr:hypothetical protein [Chloroflexota bacterium]